MANRKLGAVEGDICWFCKMPSDDESWMGLGILKATKEPVFDGRRILYHECCAVYSCGAEDTPLHGMDDQSVLKFYRHGEKASGIGLKCQLCGKRGATTGCFYGPCQQFYHYPCARARGYQGYLRFSLDGKRLACMEHAPLLPHPHESDFMGMWMEGLGSWNGMLMEESQQSWQPNYAAFHAHFLQRWEFLLKMTPAADIKAMQDLAKGQRKGIKARGKGGAKEDPDFRVKSGGGHKLKKATGQPQQGNAHGSSSGGGAGRRQQEQQRPSTPGGGQPSWYAEAAEGAAAAAELPQWGGGGHPTTSRSSLMDGGGSGELFSPSSAVSWQQQQQQQYQQLEQPPWDSNGGAFGASRDGGVQAYGDSKELLRQLLIHTGVDLQQHDPLLNTTAAAAAPAAPPQPAVKPEINCQLLLAAAGFSTDADSAQAAGPGQQSSAAGRYSTSHQQHSQQAAPQQLPGSMLAAEHDATTSRPFTAGGNPPPAAAAAAAGGGSGLQGPLGEGTAASIAAAAAATAALISAAGGGSLVPGGVGGMIRAVSGVSSSANSDPATQQSGHQLQPPSAAGRDQQQQQQQQPSSSQPDGASAEGGGSMAGQFRYIGGVQLGPGGREQPGKQCKLLDLNVLARTGRKQLSVGTLDPQPGTQQQQSQQQLPPPQQPQQQPPPPQQQQPLPQQHLSLLQSLLPPGVTAAPDPEVVQKVAAAVKAVAEAHGGAPPAAALAAAAMMAAAAATKRPSEAGAGPAAPAAGHSPLSGPGSLMADEALCYSDQQESAAQQQQQQQRHPAQHQQQYVADSNLLQAGMGGAADQVTRAHDVADLLHAQFGG